MSKTVPILLRMRDVALALRGAHDNGAQTLTRIQLQKLIYLVDVVAYLYSILPPSARHRTYKHGPYDQNIQNAVDSLAFRGFVALGTLRQSPQGDIATSYSLTSAGTSFAGMLSASPALALRNHATEAVARLVARIGWGHVVELVYAEPTFVAARGRAFSQPLPTDDARVDSAKQLISIFVRSVSAGFDAADVPRDVVLEGFFEYLRNAAAMSPQGVRQSNVEPATRA